MSIAVPYALLVQAQGGDVEALHDRGVTWVSFKPIPELACDVDFALHKFPDLGVLTGRCKVSVTSMHAGTAATATTTSAFTSI